jgi:RNA polymerase sigma factor (sigma-70 family)
MQKDTYLQIINDSDKLVNAFKANNESILKTIYQENYSKVELHVLQNKGTKQQAKDVYQEAFLAVWQNVKNHKFIPKSDTAIHGYLYTIAKNKWIDYLRSNNYKKMITTSKLNRLDLGQFKDNVIEDNDKDTGKMDIAMKAFNDLGNACKTLLTKVYFEKKSMKEIAVELQLDTASTRNKKYRCMQKLRELALNK